MKIASSAELASYLRQEKTAILANWEAAVRQLSGETDLSRPTLLDHVPMLIDQLIGDLEIAAASSAHPQNVSRIHGQQRQIVGLSIAHVVEEYKLLRVCLIDCAADAGWIVGVDAGRLLNKIIDEAIRDAIAAYTEEQDKEERRRREEYVSFIVHDLRSPLTAIYHAMALLEKRLEKSQAEDRDREIVNAVKRNIQHMQTLVVKLLQTEQNIELGPRLDLQRSALALRPVVQAAVDALSPSARNNETSVVNHVAEDIIVEGDGELLRRALQNLICNAIDHTPKGTVEIGALAENGEVACWVKDTGVGIEAADLPRVFDKFHTGNRRAGGMGLGLTAVKRIVEEHGGRVELQSQVGRGTTVRVAIPYQRQRPATARAGAT